VGFALFWEFCQKTGFLDFFSGGSQNIEKRNIEKY
jgi:hypothetical protein